LVEQLESAAVPVHFLNARSAWNAPRIVWQLRRHFQRQRPHVVQAFLYHANVAAILAARLATIRWIFTGIRVADPNPYRRQIERSLYGFAALNVCVSRSVAAPYQASGFQSIEDLLPQSNLWHRKLHVIPNAVDAASYADAGPADLGLCGFGPERRVLLFVGRLEKQKGLDWLIACLPDLLARLPNHELVLAGDGPQRDALMRQAVRLEVATMFTFLAGDQTYHNCHRATKACPTSWRRLPLACPSWRRGLKALKRFWASWPILVWSILANRTTSSRG
jgi:glycosyltransferase involved in cell wall biosynthesis